MKRKVLINSYQFIFLILLFVLVFQGFSQSTSSSWTIKSEPRKVFIENRGQFPLLNKDKIKSSDVLYALDDGATKIYFTKTGIIYTFNKTSPKKIDKDEDEDSDKPKSHEEEEKEEHSFDITTDIKYMNWENANPNVEVIAEGQASDYFSYCFYDYTGAIKNINFIKGYNKITYKNLYPNIDVEYTFHPEVGIEYSLILHPGADISMVGMKYSDNFKIKNNGDVHIPTLFGDIIDHAPLSYYSDNKSLVINTYFVKTKNTVSLKLDDGYDNSKTVIIDPWVVTPNLPNSNCVWECDKDGAGNVYIIGGDVPLTLQKYNAAGVLQWTYSTPWDTTGGSDGDWLGALATDLAGNSYVTNGSKAALQKINNAGGMVYSVTGGSMDEYWNIAFNCDQTKLIIGGTRLTGIPTITGSGVIFDINAATGSVNSLQTVGLTYVYTVMGMPVTDPDEVRSITSCRNARYYYLTLDSIGCIDQNFGICPSSAPSLFKTNSAYALGYKCENYRPSNGNAGIMAIRANRYFVYTANGTNIEKRSLFTGAVIVTAAIPGGLDSVSIGLHSPCNSGIDIDSCGNVYVGSSGAVIKYDANLNLLSSVALPFRVYDVKVSYNGNVIVAGATGNNTHINRIGYVQSINMSACPPMTLFCCDANICPASPLCSNAAPITLTAETTGGTWSGTGITNASAGTFNPAVAGPGTHTVYYTLSCGKDSISITVNNCATLSVCTETNGDLTVSGGTAPYTWQYQATSTDCSSCPLGQCMPPICNGTVVHTWTTFATGTTVPPPTPTTDTIRVTDGNSNSLVINSIASLPQCSPCPTLTITTSNIVEVLCFGGTTGSFSASTTGGASPYNYTLINGATTIVTYSNVTGSQSFTGLAAGTYTLNVKDNNNCTGTTTVIISQPASAVTASITGSTNANCGQSNGSATASGSGGTGTYTYSWNTNPVQNNAIASSLSPGNYTVTVTDATSCTATASVSISNIGGPTLQTSSTIATCGVNNGTATVHATGGSGTYTYSWNTTPVQTDSTAINLAAGNYTVTVSDGSCTASTSVTVQSSSTLSLTTHTTNANCNQANGTATVIATGGTGTYFYTWNTTPVQTNPTATNLAAGSYTVSVNDGNCTVIANVTISNISGLSATISNHVNETCSNSNGSATVHANGGTLPYTYLWSNIPAQTTSVLQNVHAGTYYVTVTDSNHCIAIDTVILTNSPAPVATITTFTNASCGLSNGSATVSVTGSATPFSYIWNTSPIQHTQTASGIPGGNYFVTVSDANSCTATATITIITSQGPLVTLLDTVNASCGHSDGSADITVTGGNLPYSFNWNSTPPQNGQNLQGVPGGNYIVIVSDANGCSTSLPVTVGQNAGPTAMATSANDTCNQSKGTATVVVSGGSGTYSYLWSNSQSDSTATGLTAGTYTVTVNDGSCTVSASVIVTSAPGPIAGFTENPRILTLIDGPVTFTDNSTGNIVNWQWNFGDGNYGSGNIIQHQYANIGTYLVTLIVTDNEGCTDTTKDTISVKDYFTFYIPNAFTPNDDGLNELFYPTGTNVDPGNFTMMIFNRWGNLIFNTSKWDITAHRGEGWNGTLNNTGDINSVVIDVYVYRILVTELGGPEHEYIGRITLIP